MDLTIRRLRQVTTAIAIRQTALDHRERLLLECATKTQEIYTAATVPTAKGKKNSLLDSASKITLFPKPKADTSSEPSTGSFEKLMILAGGLSKPR